jgi:predicted Zn-dependent peptidase
MSADFFSLQLPNGVHMVHVRTKMTSARCGILINAGSRDEKGPRGTAHFLEHLFFKGTYKRKAFHILSVIDNSGGELNAYTTKEETFIYASCLRGDLRKAIDVITDVVSNSVFPEKEIEKERGVILDEINAYRDDPGEDIMDQFEDLWFAGHELGSNILGTSADVRKISRKHILDFIRNSYRNTSLVFCTVGNFSFEKIVEYARPILEQFHFGGEPVHRVPFTTPSASFDVRVKKKIHGAHLLLGFPGVNRLADDRVVCGVLNNALGGPAMNSMLNLTLREKHGICYQIDSQLISYVDSGIWSVYLNTDPEKLEKAVDLTLAEIKKLQGNALSSLKVHQMKKQVKGQLALSQENPGNLIHHVGKSYLLRGRFETLRELMMKVDQIRPQDILYAANTYLDTDRMSRLTFLPG